MNKILHINYISVGLIYITLLVCISSRWVIDWLQIPLLINRVFTVLLYLPFILIILLKILSDIKHPQKRWSNILFYSFCIYFVLVFSSRLFNGIDDPISNIYNTIILLGSMAFCILVIEKKEKISSDYIISGLYGFAIFLIIYYAFFVLFLKEIIWYSPINTIAFGTVLLIIFPILILKIKLSEQCIGKQLFLLLTLICCSVILLTLSSRALFLLFSAEIFVLLILFIKNSFIVKRLLIVLFSAILCVGVLFVCDIDDVRYSVSRSTNLSFFTSFLIDEENEIQNNNVDGIDELKNNKEISNEQVQRSDSMRKTLLKKGLESVKSNLWLGSGEIFFEHPYGGLNGVIKAPVHNIIIQTLLCYGLLGSILLILFCFFLLYENKFFSSKNNCVIKLLLIMTIGEYLALGMVQAVGYDIFISLIISIVIVVYLKLIGTEACEERLQIGSFNGE